MAMFEEKIDPDQFGKMMQTMGPQAISEQINHAISFCWLMLPQEKKSVEAVEAEIRRIVDRSLKNLREDATAFGIAPSPPTAS